MMLENQDGSGIEGSFPPTNFDIANTRTARSSLLLPSIPSFPSMSLGAQQASITDSNDGRQTSNTNVEAEFGRSTTTTTTSDMEAGARKGERPSYLHAMMAGGIGGSIGDMLMHSLDTVKTRQQGAPLASKYETLGRAYATIFREEGFARGLYSGVTPAFLGSFPGTIIFFGTYEYSKRHLIERGCPESIAYLSSGFLGDLFASVIYVPSEVLKTRLQLQGRYNNPYFKSGYNYRGTMDATKTIIRQEGWTSLFHGYKATLMRDLPFSALQFAFYESFQKWAKIYKGQNRDIGLPLEILTGSTAGCLAGIITTPLDVVKTRIQTQVRIEPVNPASSTKPNTLSSIQKTQVRHISTSAPEQSFKKTPLPVSPFVRAISTSSPSTTTPPPAGAMILHTESILVGLKLIFRHEGTQGLFRGVFPRAVWTSIQSGTMLVMYQTILKALNPGVLIDDD